MVDKAFRFLLLFIPVSFLLEWFHPDKNLIFLSALLAIIPLAKLMGESTEVIASRTNPRLGGFLNATFGNATELILALVALTNGLTEMVKASIVGSVVSNLLLVLGLSMLCGGLKYKVQTFNRKAVDYSISLLVISTICIIIPTGFLNSTDPHTVSKPFLHLSEVIACIMLMVYGAGLLFSFHTHRDIFGTQHNDIEDSSEAHTPLHRAIITLMAATVFVALMSEMLVKSVETVSASFGLSEVFIGLIIIPIIGNAAEHSTSVLMAVKNKMDVSIEIAVGSSIQIVLLVFPVLILVGWVTGHPLSIIFNRYELVSIIAAVFIVSRVSSDGESNWFEGLLLCLVYCLIGAATLLAL